MLNVHGQCACPMCMAKGMILHLPPRLCSISREMTVMRRSAPKWLRRTASLVLADVARRRRASSSGARVG
jgi:hypothetical protein